MNQDLKIIKKKYGEKMAHFCREYFPSLLENEGLLPQLLLARFEPNHDLYDDIIKQMKENEFKDYIYSLVDVENNNEIKVERSPKELLAYAGYDLYECKSEEDIQSFKKYYAKGEVLCTFNGERLDRCYVFFAVKKNVDNIKRENFPNPQRQDEYGTSVISIQFSRDKSHTLSIKNRYNHHVNNPDNTFGNNLDNIIEGLTESFANYYGLVQQHSNVKFELENYVRANDGKYYKYNLEMHNVYYCPNNIIIDNFEVKRYEKEKYIIFEYFILDLVKKEVRLYDQKIKDSFPNTLVNIQKIEVDKKDKEKEIKFIFQDNSEVKIALDKDNHLIELDNSSVKNIGDNFLIYNKNLKKLHLPSVEKIGDYFLGFNLALEKVDLPSLEKIGNIFMFYNKKLYKLTMPHAREIGDYFLCYNESLKKLDLPSLEKIGDDFLRSNKCLQTIFLPKLQSVGGCFLEYNEALLELNLPNLSRVGDNFVFYNEILQDLNLPKIQIIGNNFLLDNTALLKLDLPYLRVVGDGFLSFNKTLQELILIRLYRVGKSFLRDNNSLQIIYLPSLSKVNYSFLSKHPIMKHQNLKNDFKLSRRLEKKF